MVLFGSICYQVIYDSTVFHRVSELEYNSSTTSETGPRPSSESNGPLTALDCKGVAMGCFVLARCLQLGQAVTKNDAKAQEYYIKVRHWLSAAHFWTQAECSTLPWCRYNYNTALHYSSIVGKEVRQIYSGQATYPVNIWTALIGSTLQCHV